MSRGTAGTLLHGTLSLSFDPVIDGPGPPFPTTALVSFLDSGQSPSSSRMQERLTCFCWLGRRTLSTAKRRPESPFRHSYRGRNIDPGRRPLGEAPSRAFRRFAIWGVSFPRAPPTAPQGRRGVWLANSHISGPAEWPRHPCLPCTNDGNNGPDVGRKAEDPTRTRPSARADGSGKPSRRDKAPTHSFRASGEITCFLG